MSLIGYDIEATIARSERTLICRAVRRRDGRRVVLKQLTEACPPLAVRRRLEFEYQILCRLRGTGVLEALELANDAGRPVLVLEDFGAHNLALAPGQRLPLPLFFEVATQVTRALGSIHDQGVIHKDIKPQNLIFNRDTLVVKLIDFQLATELSRESHDISAPRRLEGSVPYMSPEQTGRMNRSLDYRTDYYSLGVTFFQLLTGTLPFAATDVIGWVHAHISKPPVDASTISDTPPQLSAVVRKLMAKDPDARYQSARGLLNDLERCRESYAATGEIPLFELGRGDVSERLQVSERIVGRAPELRTLLGVFEQASRSNARLLLVAGCSGVGKSSLIREVYKPITSLHGSFVSGKFDQLERNVPYGALARAIRALVRQLLAGTEDELRAWRERLLEALGPNAGVMVDLIPELERIIGAPPPPPELNPTEAQHRFKRVFGDLIRALARREHPLVIFLDDLQWTDASTPELLADLFLGHDVRHLLVIGAYRDNEVDEGDLLPITVKRIRERRPETVHDVALQPLSLASVTELCADSLRKPIEACQALGELIYEKTAGNPFFAAELLAELHRSGAIVRGADGTWETDLVAARRVSASDNVVDLMLARLEALPAPSRAALSVAACVSNEFDLVTLAPLLDQSPSETAQVLWEPITRGFIVPRDDSYRLARDAGAGDTRDRDVDLGVRYQFQHDRIQQAAYSLIAPSDRAATHLRIGRRLLRGEGTGEQLFEITNHLNLGRALISDTGEREELVTLNRRAAASARQSTAYAIAAAYLDTAAELLSAEEWAERPKQRFELSMQRVECVLMAGEHARAAELCRELAELALEPGARGAVYLLEARILEAQARFVDAVGATRAGLALFGITLPSDPEAISREIGAGIGRMQAHLASRSPEDLLRLPTLTDPDKRMAMDLLFQSIPSAIQTFPPLFILAELIMFDLAVEHGLSPASAKNFVDCGIIQGGILGDYERAYRLGKVAFQVLDRFDARAIASSVNFVFATYVSSWRAGPDEALAAFDDCYRLGMETGDLQHMGFGTALRMHRLLHLGHELADYREELSRAIGFLERSNLPSQRTAVILGERALARLCDADAGVEQLEQGDALATARVLESQNPQWIYAYAESQLVVSILLDDYDSAERWRQMAEPHVAAATALVSVPEYHLCEALIAARRAAADASEAERAQALATVRQAREKLETWAKHCPTNFAHKFHLVAAEQARLEGAPLDGALEHYQRAAETTGASYIQMRALSLELQARFWEERQHATFARALRREALALYERWGARTKVKLLAQRRVEQTEGRAGILASCPPLSSHLDQSRSVTHQGLAREALDLMSVIKATQALSSEVRSDRLFETLMSTLLEDAAAERGSLILYDEGTGALTVAAQASLSGPARANAEPLESAEHICTDLVRFAIRSGESLVIDDAAEHSRYSRDAYVRAHGVRSALCLPIVHQGKLVGAFYAENNMTGHAFPADRVDTLRLIASQAAISIVNAELYANLERKVEERTHEIAGKNREIVAMLDGMEEGVFSIDSELRIQPQYSRQLPALLGNTELAGQRFIEPFFAGSNASDDARAATEAALQFSFGNDLSVAALNANHLTREFSRGEGEHARHFEVSWNPITGNDGVVEKFLIVLRDVTLIRTLRDEQAQAAWEAEVVAQILATSVEEFRGFCESARVLLQAGRGLERAGRALGRDEGRALFRDVHTIKGNARAIGLRRLVDELHGLEPLLDDPSEGGSSPLPWPEVFRKLEAVEALLEAHERIGERKLGQLWTGDGERLKTAIQHIQAVLDGARAHPSQPAPALAEIERTVRRSQSVPLDELLRDATRPLPALAATLGKPAPRVAWQEENVALAPAWAKVMRDALTHALPNALDHGIEPAAERQARGKSPEGRIQVTAERRAGRLRLRLADDGRGLALARLRAASERRTLPDEALADSIFAPGVTTAESVSTISGRGVGMDAVRGVVQARGGRVSIAFTGEERAGYRPFELVFDLPADAVLD